MALSIPLTLFSEEFHYEHSTQCMWDHGVCSMVGTAILETQLHNPVSISHMLHAPFPCVLSGLHLFSHLATARLSLPLDYLTVAR